MLSMASSLNTETPTSQLFPTLVLGPHPNLPSLVQGSNLHLLPQYINLIGNESPCIIRISIFKLRRLTCCTLSKLNYLLRSMSPQNGDHCNMVKCLGKDSKLEHHYFSNRNHIISTAKLNIRGNLLSPHHNIFHLLTKNYALYEYSYLNLGTIDMFHPMRF